MCIPYEHFIHVFLFAYYPTVYEWCLYSKDNENYGKFLNCRIDYRCPAAFPGGDVALEAVEGEEDDFDEEEILGAEDMDSADLGKLTPQEEEAALTGNIKVKDVGTQAAYQGGSVCGQVK